MLSRRAIGTHGVRFSNGALIAVAVMLGVVALQNAADPLGSVAAADNRAGGAPDGLMAFNAADQRVRMIAALQKIETRLAAIEGKFNAGPLPVKVVEIPQSTSSQTRATGSGGSGEANTP